MSDISVFRVVSTGQVLENLKIGERVISVKLIEQDPARFVDALPNVGRIMAIGETIEV